MIPQVTRWGPAIQAEITKRGYPWPVELIFTLILRESRGIAGAVNPTRGESGLMQVMPSTLKWFNKKTGNNISLSTLRSKSDAAASKQIQVGLWVLATFWRSAYNWMAKKNKTRDIPLDDLLHFADAFYAAGPGRVQGMAKKLPRATWSLWKQRYPKSNINIHADAVWEGTNEQRPTWNLARLSQWLNKGSIDPDNGKDPIDPTTGLLLGMLIIVGAMWWMKKGKKK